MAPRLEFAVIGDPIAQSLSPRIQGAALEAMGIDARYRAIRVDLTGLHEIVTGLRDGALTGINVTMPLKRDAFDVADLLTDDAARSGSVNTLRSRDRTVEGHSTDAIAVRESLHRLDPGGRRAVVILGSGGAAAAALGAAGDRVTYVMARSWSRAEALSRRFGGVSPLPWGDSMPGAIVVNATPAGANGEPLPPAVVESATGLIDLPYGEEPTSTVRMAREMTIPVVDGIEFLVDQACASLRWWLDAEPPREVMMRAARKA